MRMVVRLAGVPKRNFKVVRWQNHQPSSPVWCIAPQSLGSKGLANDVVTTRERSLWFSQCAHDCVPRLLEGDGSKADLAAKESRSKEARLATSLRLGCMTSSSWAILMGLIRSKAPLLAISPLIEVAAEFKPRRRAWSRVRSLGMMPPPPTLPNLLERFKRKPNL
ncbi:hypothetical protein CRG98_013798 [Punica granatum]|uniref:Uncharacterized protein n=1 Tax=Punica granatum TaxID=22663 RepID=A0A2I0KBB2_PUNGR|nr:hypothetical protein CRG98_013798 [Punica granatum]